MTQIAPAAAGKLQIEVTFHVDANGAFGITVKDAHTGRDLPVLER